MVAHSNRAMDQVTSSDRFSSKLEMLEIERTQNTLYMKNMTCFHSRFYWNDEKYYVLSVWRDRGGQREHCGVLQINTRKQSNNNINGIHFRFDWLNYVVLFRLVQMFYIGNFAIRTHSGFMQSSL